MRTASRLDATVSGADQGDALSQLEIDHRRVESLFARASLVPHGPARRALVDQIREELAAHAERALQLLVQAHVAVEEGEIFPAFRQTATPATLRTLDDEAATHRAGGSR